jgi:hypothetical protein
MTRDVLALAFVRRLKCMKGALHIEREYTCNLGVQHGVWERVGCGCTSPQCGLCCFIVTYVGPGLETTHYNSRYQGE